jgi:hypothetical protein
MAKGRTAHDQELFSELRSQVGAPERTRPFDDVGCGGKRQRPAVCTENSIRHVLAEVLD